MEKFLLGSASEVEKQELFERADKKDIQEILDSRDLADRYDIYNKVDADAAFSLMLERIAAADRAKTKDNEKEEKRHTITILQRWMRYAATLIIISGITFMVSHYVSDSADKGIIAYNPKAIKQLSSNMQEAMERAEENGRIGATVRKISTEEQTTISELAGLSTEELLEAQRITTVHDKEYWLRLCDGTMVHINGGTRLIYPEHFYGQCRDVYIEGEAYFMVAEDKKHPFVVHTKHGEIKEYGTEFNVNTRATGMNKDNKEAEATEVVLVNGSISVKLANASREHMMHPGEMAIMKTDGSVALGQVDVTPYVAWNTGNFEFREKTLAEVMTTISKWYGADVVFRNESLKEKRINGAFDRYESISDILLSLSRITESRIRISDGVIIVE